MASTLSLSLETVDAALRALAETGLIAATERIVQVLPVPVRGASTPAAPRTTTTPPPTTVSPPSPQVQRDLSEEEILDREAEARACIARFCGTRKPSEGVVRALARSLALKGKGADGGGDE